MMVGQLTKPQEEIYKSLCMTGSMNINDEVYMLFLKATQVKNLVTVSCKSTVALQKRILLRAFVYMGSMEVMKQPSILSR